MCIRDRPGVVQRVDMRQQCACIQIHRMPANWLHHRHPRLNQGVAQIGGGTNAVAQVIVIHHFFQTLRQRFQITPSKTAVGGEAFGEDQQIAALFGQRIIVERKPCLLYTSRCV